MRRRGVSAERKKAWFGTKSAGSETETVPLVVLNAKSLRMIAFMASFSEFP
jgi:hypothetical protein